MMRVDVVFVVIFFFVVVVIVVVDVLMRLEVFQFRRQRTLKTRCGEDE